MFTAQANRHSNLTSAKIQDQKCFLWYEYWYK